MATRADKSGGRRPRVVDVRGARKKLGLSQVRLAAISEVSRFRLHQYEVGTTQLSEPELRRIALVLRHMTEEARTRAIAREKALAERLVGGQAERDSEALSA